MLPHDCRPANAGFEVFTDDEFQVGRSFPPVQHPSSTVETAPFWQSLGSQKEVKKENTQQPAKWTEGKVCILLLCSMQVHNRYELEHLLDSRISGKRKKILFQRFGQVI